MGATLPGSYLRKTGPHVPVTPDSIEKADLLLDALQSRIRAVGQDILGLTQEDMTSALSVLRQALYEMDSTTQSLSPWEQR